MVPVIGERVLGLSAFPIGLLMSIEGLGSLIGALLVTPLFKPIAYTRVYLCSSFAFLLGVLAFGMSGWFPLSLVLNLICGASLAGFAVMQSTIMFLAARPEMRSRGMGVLTVGIGAGPARHAASWLARRLAGRCRRGPDHGGEGLIALALTAVIWPEMWRATDLAPTPADAAE